MELLIFFSILPFATALFFFKKETSNSSGCSCILVL